MKTLYGVVALAILLPLGMRAASWLEDPTIEVNADQAEAGLVLFEHQWRKDDPLAKGGDGLGPVFNAESCVACHFQGGPGGGGPNERNVVAFTVRPTIAGGMARQGVVHAAAVSPVFQESLRDVHPSLPLELPQVQVSPQNTMEGCFISSSFFPPGVDVSERNTPALFGAKLIDEIPDRVVIAAARRQRLKWAGSTHEFEHAPVGRIHRLADGRVGKFGWKGQTASLGEFVRAACANELGLGNPSQAQPAPMKRMTYQPPGLDLTDEQCDQMTAFISSLSCPVQTMPAKEHERENAEAGKKLFESVGCADCHVPDMGHVQGIYSDLLLHRMGETLIGGGSYNDFPLPTSPEVEESPDEPHPSEWQTPPLWGVASSAPYLHDGRAPNLHDAIVLHDGQGASSSQRFQELSLLEREQLIAFLETLQAPTVGVVMTNDEIPNDEVMTK